MSDSPTLENLRSLIAEHAVIDIEQIGTYGTFDTLGDLGFDSLDLVELVLDIEELFEIEIPATSTPKPATTVAELHDLIQTLQVAGTSCPRP